MSIKLMCRGASVWLKVAAGVFAILAACLWFSSATVPANAEPHNVYAAALTGVSALLQAIYAMIDAWIAPTATWGGIAAQNRAGAAISPPDGPT
jgi:hypothetical protein